MAKVRGPLLDVVTAFVPYGNVSSLYMGPSAPGSTSELGKLVPHPGSEPPVLEAEPRDCQPPLAHTSSCASSAVSPYYRTKLRGLYTTAKADAEAECK